MNMGMIIKVLALSFLLVPMSVAQPEVEILDFEGEVSFVDVSRSQITVVGSNGDELVFDVTEETEITYTDPETDETENLALSDIDVGETVSIRYSVSDETNLAWEIEVRPTPPAF
jgi:hypothetical protein